METMRLDEPSPGVVVRPTGTRALTVLFCVTAFLGAALLFLVEPLVAKLLLPAYGGSATVWSTSTLFFQTLLLGAYGYAHWSTGRMERRWQPRAHLLVLAGPLLVLPLVVPADAAPTAGHGGPVLWLLRTLTVLVGLPFVVVATTGPLLQKWYSWTDSRRAEDPYFLFAASNLGSFVGLLAYPFVVEPQVTLAHQRSWWSLGYVGFLLLTASCAVLASRQRPDRSLRPPDGGVPAARTPRPSRTRVLGWAGLAFLPASLMLGVTSHISTDVAAIPLLWVVPLAIYLGSFVLAFGRTSRTPPASATRAAVGAAMLAVVTAVGASLLPISLSIVISMTMLGLVSFAAHARLAAQRPATDHLTGFYMVVAAGGALGGLLNGFVAPLLFDSVLEYPLAIAAAPLLLAGLQPPATRLSRWMAANRVRTVTIGLAAIAALVGLRIAVAAADGGWPEALGITLLGVLLGLLVSQRLVLAILSVLAVMGTVVFAGVGGTLDQTRTFYGTYRVFGDDHEHVFVHGTTVHGSQFTDPADRDTPTTYYSRSGPLGDVFDVADAAGAEDVGVVGLGAGTVASYGLAGQHFTFFEIDPAVVRVARDPRLFTYLADSPARVDTVVGDGRLSLGRYPGHSFDLLVLDAFSSDAIPVHLLTTEAVRRYAGRLRPGGLMAVHITNRTFDLQPVLAADADDLGWTGAVRQGGDGKGALSAQWVVLARSRADLAPVLARPGWEPLSGRRVRWTDDYSSVLSVLK